MQQFTYTSEGDVGPLPPFTQFFSRPKDPTPGSTFNLPKKPLKQTGSNTTTTFGTLLDGSVNSRITGVHDVQMTEIPHRHAEKQKPARGRGTLFGLSSGGIFDGPSGGIFSSVIGANGNSLMAPFQLSSLESPPSNLNPASGMDTLSGFGFDMTNFDDDDELSTVKGHIRNGQTTGPEYLIMTPSDTPCPGQDDIMFMSIASVKPMNHGSYFESYIEDAQGVGKNFAGHYGFSLAAFNYYIASLQTYNTNSTLVEATKQFQKHRDLIFAFNLMGVINSEQFAGGGASYQSIPTPGFNPGFINGKNQKVVNVIHQGIVNTKNIFGPVRCGNRLYFIWKKIDAPSHYILDANKHPIQATSKAPGNSATIALSKKPFQLVPYTHPIMTSPPMSELEYTSDHLSWVAGYRQPLRSPLKYHATVFHLGQVNKPQESMSYNDSMQAEFIKNTCKRSVYDANCGADNIFSIFVTPGLFAPFTTIESAIAKTGVPHQTVSQFLKKNNKLLNH